MENYVLIVVGGWNGAEIAEGLQNGRGRRRFSSWGGGGLWIVTASTPVSTTLSCNGGRLLPLLLLFKGRLQVANVVDDVLDHFEFTHFTMARHVRYQFFQFAQVHLNFHLLRRRRRRRNRR